MSYQKHRCIIEIVHKGKLEDGRKSEEESTENWQAGLLERLLFRFGISRNVRSIIQCQVCDCVHSFNLNRFCMKPKKDAPRKPHIIFVSTTLRFAVFALGSSAYPNFCSFGKFLDNILGELGGERLMKIVLGDDLCGQEQEFRKWACEVFKTACECFCLDLNEMSEASMSLKSETLTKENTRFQPIKDFNIPLNALLSKYHNKTVQACRVKNKPLNLHGGASSERSTVLVEILIDSVSKVLSNNRTREKANTPKLCSFARLTARLAAEKFLHNFHSC